MLISWVILLALYCIRSLLSFPSSRSRPPVPVLPFSSFHFLPPVPSYLSYSVPHSAHHAPSPTLTSLTSPLAVGRTPRAPGNASVQNVQSLRLSVWARTLVCFSFFFVSLVRFSPGIILDRIYSSVRPFSVFTLRWRVLLLDLHTVPPESRSFLSPSPPALRACVLLLLCDVASSLRSRFLISPPRHYSFPRFPLPASPPSAFPLCLRRFSLSLSVLFPHQGHVLF